MTNRTRQDPQRIGRLRNRFVADVRKRMRGIKRSIKDLVYGQDVFGLGKRSPQMDVARLFGNSGYAAWASSDPGAQVVLFEEWLAELTAAGEFALVDGFHGTYIESAHMQGRRSVAAQKGIAAGEVNAATFAAPKIAGRAELLYSRSLSKLKGLNNDMSDKLTDALTRGFLEGRSPRVLARELGKVVDSLTRRRALTIARTELAYAYAEGQLDGMQADGQLQVKLFAEWSTAGDDRVCPKCQPMDGKILKIEEARGLIPLHPDCRCAWIPMTPSDLAGKRAKRRDDLLKLRKRRWEKANGKLPPPQPDLPKPVTFPKVDLEAT